MYHQIRSSISLWLQWRHCGWPYTDLDDLGMQIILIGETLYVVHVSPHMKQKWNALL